MSGRGPSFTHRLNQGSPDCQADVAVAVNVANLMLPQGSSLNVEDSGALVEQIPRRARTSSLLFSDSPSPDIGDGANLYNWLIGGWDLDVIDYGPDGSRLQQKGECHFTWALEGRAVQDVWIIPPPSLRRADEPPSRTNRYGTTIRVYDARRKIWRITWINPVTGVHNSLFGRREGNAIVHEGTQEDGSIMRWTFVDITDRTFRWTGEQSTDQGRTWQLGVEFFAKRISSQALR